MNGSGNDYGFLEGNGILIVLFFFLAFSGGLGFGGNNSGFQEALQNQNVINKLDTMATGLGQASWNINNSVMSGTYDIKSAIAGLGTQLQACCCTTQKEIIESRYANERNTSAIIQRINELENSHKDELIAQLTNKNNINETVTQIANLQGRYVTNPPCPPYPYGNCGGGLYA